MYQCCAIGCGNVGIHKFPKNIEIRKQWEIAVRRKHCTKSLRVCSAHFRAEDYLKEGFYTGMKIDRRVLRKGAIPSLFVWSKKESLKDEQRMKTVEICEERQVQQLETIKPDKPEDTIAEIKACRSSAANDINCAIKVEVVDVAMKVQAHQTNPASRFNDVACYKFNKA